MPIFGYFKVFKEYPQKSQIWKSETSPNQGTWLGIPGWDLSHFSKSGIFMPEYSLNTLKYLIMGICYFFLCMPSIKLAGLLGPIFAGCVPLASQTPTPLQSTQRPIIIDPILITFLGQMYFTLRIHMCFSNFQRFLLFFTLKSRKRVKPHSITSFKKCNPIRNNPVMKMRPHPVTHHQEVLSQGYKTPAISIALELPCI